MLILDAEENERYLHVVHDFLAQRAVCFETIHLFLQDSSFHMSFEEADGLKPIEGGRLLFAQEAMVCSLVLYSPNRLVVHTQQTTEQLRIINVLQEIFEDKLFLCYGCSLCQSK